VAVLAASGCTRPPSTALDDDITATLKGTNSPRTVGGRTYTAQPVEANLGPHRFMFPANLYYNQIGQFAGGGVMLAVFWPDFDSAPPGDHPLRSVEDGYRQVSIDLRYVGGAGGGGLLGAGSERARGADAALGADALCGESVVGGARYAGDGAGLVCGAEWGWTGEDVHQL